MNNDKTVLQNKEFDLDVKNISKNKRTKIQLNEHDAYRKGVLEWVFNEVDTVGKVTIGNSNCLLIIQRDFSNKNEDNYNIYFEAKNKKEQLIYVVRELTSSPYGYNEDKVHIINASAQDVVNITILALEAGGKLYE